MSEEASAMLAPDRATPGLRTWRPEDEVRGLRTQARTIQAQAAHAISVAASDAGSNKIEFNPLQLQLVRVVDTADKEHFSDVVSAQTNTIELARRQFDTAGNPLTPMACITTGGHSDGWWPRSVVSGGNPGGDAIRLGFGLVKEIVAGVLTTLT